MFNNRAERGGRWLAVSGEARWHPADQPVFPYLELHLDIAYNLASPIRRGGAAPALAASASSEACMMWPTNGRTSAQ